MASTLRLPYLATAAISGLLFGAGLYVSQMVDPLKVLRFLDFTAIPTGGWDPSLAFVMLGAIPVMFVAVRFSRRRTSPMFDSRFHEPTRTRIDLPLVAGAAIFGVGWSMSGVCPGPAIALVAFWPQDIVVLLVAIFVGSYAASALAPSGEPRQLVPAE